MPSTQLCRLLSGSPVRRSWRQSLLLASIAASLATYAVAVAQDFRTDPVNAASKHVTVAQIAVKNPGRYAEDKAKVTEYFTKFYFPEMTQTGADNLARLGDARYNLFKNFLWKTNNEQLQQDLTNIAFDAATQIAVANNPPYHPAVRYNAVLILGMLDKQYAIDGGANSRPPVPLPKANALLTKIIAAAADGKQVPPPVTLGALIGLERHAQFREALDPGAADAMTVALVKLVNHEKPIQEMDREAYAWLRLRAASVLAQLGAVGPKNEVHDALIKLVADFKSLDDRCESAALLDKIKYEGANVDGAAAEQMLKLSRDLAEAEVKRATEFEEARIGGGGGFVPGLGERFTPNSDLGEQETFPRRHVLARLAQLRSGLRKVKPVVPQDAQPKFDAVIAALDPAITIFEDKDTVELKLTDAIKTMARAIDVAAAPTEKPAADAEDVFE